MNVLRGIRQWLHESSGDPEHAELIDWQYRGEALEEALHALLDAVDASTGSDGVARFDAHEALARVGTSLKIL